MLVRAFALWASTALLVTVLAVPAMAGQSQEVTITAYNADGVPLADNGTFVVTGEAAADLCSEGTWADAGGRVWQMTDDGLKVDVYKLYTCSETEKTFELRLKATIVFGEPSIHPRWTLTDSTGFDPAPAGKGDIVAMPSGEGEVFVGLLRFR